MRRFASILLQKRDKPDVTSTTLASPSSTSDQILPQSRSGYFASIASITTNTMGHQRPPATTPGYSSSSDGSASVRTPDDDGVTIMPPQTKKNRWTIWLGGKRAVDGSGARNDRTEPYESARSTPSSIPPVIQADSESDEDDTSSGSSDSNSSPIYRPSTISHKSIATTSQTNLLSLTRNSLSAATLSHPPLVDVPSSPLFPRSSNPSSTLPPMQTTGSIMQRRLLICRLERKDLSRNEVAYIAAFGTRPTPAVSQRSLKRTEEDAMSVESMRVGPVSRGLRRWASRPCFEERLVLWVTDQRGDLTWRTVEGCGRGLAVAELEFSESLYALAGLHLTDREFEELLQTASTKTPASRPAPPRKSSRPRNVTFKSMPSPLRIQSGPPAIPVLSPVSSLALSTSSSSPELLLTPPTVFPREVRFADQTVDADDNIPLGYTLQMRKAREGKEKFLLAEHGKRTQETVRELELARVQEDWRRDRLRLQEEERRVRLEEEQSAREEVQRAREERLKRKYVEEVAAARQRRENQRMGSENVTNIRDAHARQREPVYSRPGYDLTGSPSSAARGGPLDGSKPSQSHVRNNSPTSSRRSSQAESASGSRRSSVIQSRHSFTYSASDETRAQMNRRQSTTSESLQQSSASSPKRSLLPRSQSSPYASNPYANGIPPVPSLSWDVPLLPPTPAFMLQQYPTRSSPSPSRSNSRDSLPRFGSRDSLPRSSSRDSSPSPRSTAMHTRSSTDTASVPTCGPLIATADHARYASAGPPVRQHSTAFGGNVDDRRTSHTLTASRSHSGDVRQSPASRSAQGYPPTNDKRRTFAI